MFSQTNKQDKQLNWQFWIYQKCFTPLAFENYSSTQLLGKVALENLPTGHSVQWIDKRSFCYLAVPALNQVLYACLYTLYKELKVWRVVETLREFFNFFAEIEMYSTIMPEGVTSKLAEYIWNESMLANLHVAALLLYSL